MLGSDLSERLVIDSDKSAERATAAAKRKLLIGAALCLLFMCAEIVGGYLAHSLAIMTDAAHMLSDVAGFLVGVLSLFLTNRAPTPKYSFGYHIAEVLGAMVSISIVWLMTGVLLYEATNRLFSPEPVDGRTMFVVSLIGVVMNVVLMAVLGHGEGGHGGHGGGHGHSHGGGGHGGGHGGGLAPVRAVADGHDHSHAPAAGHGHGHGHAEEGEGGEAGHGPCCGEGEGAGGAGSSLALRAAMVHVIGDIVQSVGVCVAAALIWAFSDRWLDASGVSYWYRVDPVCTYLFSLLVLYSSYGTMSEAVHLLMAGVPSDINISEVRSRLKAIPSVVGAHDVHVWALSASKRNMWAHLTVSAGADSASVLHAAQRAAADFGCDHTCFQLESEGTLCAALHCGPPDVAHDHSHA